MCMITYLPPFVRVPVDGIMNGATWNDDGHGWAIAAQTNLMLVGRYMDSETAMTTFKISREAFPQAPAVFHSRWATHGEVTTKNVHPFYVGKGRNTVVAHNGVLPAAFHPGKKDRRSDTAVMAQEWLADQSRGTWTRRERRRIGNLIGTSNKLVILSVDPILPKPKGFIVNPEQGHWDHGAWFSNYDYCSKYSRHWSYSGSYSGKGSDDNMDSASTSVAINKATSMFNDWGTVWDDECPICYSRGQIDLAANVCTCCTSCLDCFEALEYCECIAAARAQIAAQANDDDSVEAGKAVELWHPNDMGKGSLGWVD